MRINSSKIVKIIEKKYPLFLADDWDNAGFQVGNPDRAIDKILICLDVTEAVINEAVEKSVDLIIAHHPLIFKGLKSLSEQDPKAKLVTRLIKENINLYALHTHFDNAHEGLSDIFARHLGLRRLQPLIKVHEEPLYKLIVYTPKGHDEVVRQALFEAGAGAQGAYDHSGFEMMGTGMFRPLEGANPTIGTVGSNTYLQEVRFETVVPESCIKAVEAALIKSHPYEEVAYDLVKLQKKGHTHALGRLGYLKMPMAFDEWLEHIKDAFDLTTVKVAFPPKGKVSKVGCISGAGMDFIGDVAKMGCDVFVTGDIKYHEAMEAEAYGITLVDIGHFESEVIYTGYFAKWLEEEITQKDYQVVVDVSDVELPVFKQY